MKMQRALRKSCRGSTLEKTEKRQQCEGAEKNREVDAEGKRKRSSQMANGAARSN